MSLLDALRYPIRGKNIWVFLVLTLIYFLVSLLININHLGMWWDAGLGILTAFYCVPALKELTLGNFKLPTARVVLENSQHSLVVSMAGFVYLLGAYIVIRIFAFYAAGLDIIARSIYAFAVYLLLAIATIRYLGGGNWRVMYRIRESLLLILSHKTQTLRLIVHCIGLIALLYLVLMASSFIFGVLSNLTGQGLIVKIDELSLITIIMGLFASSLFVYALLVNTYFWYAYGLELGSFVEKEKEKSKLKPQHSSKRSHASHHAERS